MSTGSSACLLVGRLALAALSLAIVLGASELALRTFSQPTSKGLRGLHEARPDRPWLFGLRPGAIGTVDATGDTLYQINADGFRDQTYTRPKSSGVFRILVLGDSLTFGYGVAQEQTYPKRMEMLMKARLGEHVEVLNLGVGGYNPYNQAALLADVGLSYEPDLVLAQFCTNDLNDPTLHFDAQTLLHLGAIPDDAFPDPSARRQPATPELASGLGACRGLRLCALADDAWLAWRATEPDAASRTAALRSLDQLDQTRARWLARWYGGMNQRAADAGARFAVLVFPFRGQLGDPESDRLQEQLTTLGERGGWPALDLLPAFRRAHSAGEEPLFLDIWHPTPLGYEVAADAIIGGLERRGLIPCPARG